MFNTVLVLSVLLAYGVGNIAAIEVVHEGDCHITISECDHGHDHDHHHGDHQDSDGDDEENGHSHSHSHSHFVSFDVPPVLSPINTPKLNLLQSATFKFAAESVLRPEGPFYDLTKPPQRG